MASSIAEFEELSDKLAKHAHQLAEAKPKFTGLPAEICAFWAIAKPFVQLAITLLGKLPFKWAKDIVTGLQALEDALNSFCQSLG